jgi:NAD-dependent dihydropyrimidine dehydrogenase PreA subunit
MATSVDRGYVTIAAELCKGCGLCEESCTPRVLKLSPNLNHLGYHPAEYLGHGCNGCGLCFYACPEPGAIQVYKLAAGTPGGAHA